MGNQRILVVDDEEPIRNLITDTLQPEGHTVIVAGDGATALRLALEQLPDLILCDVQLPDIQGIDLARRIREFDADVPIVIVTGLADVDLAVSALKLGASDYITKPFNPRQLLGTVQTILVRASQKKALAFQKEEERRRLRSLFEKCVSPVVVERLLEQPEGVRLQGERRQATMLFGDIRGFTAFSGSFDPVQTVQLLNSYLSAVVDVADAYEGLIDKFQGDGIMLVFGAPVPQSDAALRAVTCALEIQKRVSRIQIPGFSSVGVPVGIGINTGEVVAGTIGCDRRFEYTVIGDPVNIAKRLESHAASQQVLVSDTTYQLVKDYVDAQDLGSFRVGGRHGFINAHNVTGLKDAAILPPWHTRGA
jgi:adenylate cyclase